MPRVLELAASKAADFPAFDYSGFAAAAAAARAFSRGARRLVAVNTPRKVGVAKPAAEKNQRLQCGVLKRRFKPVRRFKCVASRLHTASSYSFLQPVSLRCDFSAAGFATLRPQPKTVTRSAIFVRRANLIDTTPTHQVRRVRLRAHRATRHACLRQACLRHACLRLPPRACLRDACHATIVSSHVVSARVKRAGPVSASPPSSLLACAIRCDAAIPRDSSGLPPCATL